MERLSNDKNVIQTEHGLICTMLWFFALWGLCDRILFARNIVVNNFMYFFTVHYIANISSDKKRLDDNVDKMERPFT